MAMKAAAVRPAPWPRTSFTNRYAAKAQKDEKRGAVKTQTCRKCVSVVESKEDKCLTGEGGGGGVVSNCSYWMGGV